MQPFRGNPQQAMNFGELKVDNFAGGGGASTGIESATGSPVDIAINHDKDAIRMHETNHPHTEHLCESVWDVDPIKACAGRPVGLAWFSPDCKHFSKAKGGKPVEKSIRGLAWVAKKWAGTVAPRIIMLENVEEFKTWGPLKAKRCKSTGRVMKRVGDDHKKGDPLPVALPGERVPVGDQMLVPDVDNSGRTFRDFVRCLERLGYAVEYRELRACDYGTPTIRKRFFLIARNDGEAIVWPDATHGDPKSEAVKSGKVKPEIITSDFLDFSVPCPSIFERKRPLVEKTMKRIAKGIKQFIIDNPAPFVVDHGGVSIAPFITEHANGSNQRNMAANEPLRTLCAQVKGGHFAVVAPILDRQFGNGQCRSVEAPLGTVMGDGGGKSALVSAFLAKHFGGVTGVRVDTPLPTVTTRGTQTQLVQCQLAEHEAVGDHSEEVWAFLLKYYGSEQGACSVELPLGTVTVRDRFALVTIKGVDYRIVDIGMRMLTPKELYAAQGFPADYIIDRDFNGVPMTKTAQVARCGNAVCPPLAEALVRANYVEVAAGVRVAA